MAKYNARRGPGIPAGLMDGVEATQWDQPGDHPAVVDAPPGLKHASGETFEELGQQHFVLQDVHGIVRHVDEDGHNHDYIVMPGYFVLTNPAPDNTVWALSPEHMSAWFQAA